MASSTDYQGFPQRPPRTPSCSTTTASTHLLPDEEWGRLPLAIWRRFSKRLADGETVVYVGEIEEASFSRAGWWLAQLARADRRAAADRAPRPASRWS